MKSIAFRQYGGPEVLELIEREIPSPGRGEVLVRMSSAGISSPDILMRSGKYPWTQGILPFYPGIDGAGTVEALGVGVTGLRTGQPVYLEHPVVCSCYAEYKTVPIGQVTPLPEGIDTVLSGAMLNHIIAWGMLTEICRGTDHRTIYMKGAAGGMGVAVTQLAPLIGLEVIASGSTNEKSEFIKSQGAAHVFNHSMCDPVEAVLDVTGGKGADIILDQIVGSDFCRQFDMLADLGLIVVYNTQGGFPNEKLLEVMSGNAQRCPGVRIYSAHVHDKQRERFAENKKTVFQYLYEGRIKPHIGARFALDHAEDAHRLLESRNFFGRIILTI